MNIEIKAKQSEQIILVENEMINTKNSYFGQSKVYYSSATTA